MLKSVQYLKNKLSGPLGDCCGPNARLLTVEVHGEEVRGLAICPGRIVKYVLEAQSEQFRTEELLILTDKAKEKISKLY